MSTQIREFWLANPQYWLATGKTRDAVDELIYETFQTINFMNQDTFGIIIYLDQFMRHFSRIVDIPEPLIRSCREYAAELTLGISPDTLLSVTEAELIWWLMPLKHITNWTPLFQTIVAWVSHGGRLVTDYPLVNRFFMDAYKKAYTYEVVASALTVAHLPSLPFIAADICESYPSQYLEKDTWISKPLPEGVTKLTKPFATYKDKAIAISLSGGVDSMLMCYLLRRLEYDVVAIHIVYGNRDESEQERRFIVEYCRHVGIPLYMYTVEWLRRGFVGREFYEDMTRRLRFSAYKALKRPVFLGHIQDDVLENIWTNFARGTHLENLAKFAPEAEESGVIICRPWLSIQKSLIYAIAEDLAIPFLKNTTPSWSNRGKFRTAFYKATQEQFGDHVDTTVLSVATRFTKQAGLLKRLLYDPISESWDAKKRCIDITNTIGLCLDSESWLHILTELAHKRLAVTKPSHSACVDFAGRIARGSIHGQTFVLNKHLSLRAEVIAGRTYLFAR